MAKDPTIKTMVVTTYENGEETFVNIQDAGITEQGSLYVVTDGRTVFYAPNHWIKMEGRA